MNLQSLSAELPDRISKDAINELPLVRYEGPIHIVSDPDEVPGAIAQIARESCVGFDTETRPVFKKGQSFPTSLVQMAGADAVWLFQLRNLNGLEGVVDILTNPDILKVGIALRDDFIQMKLIQQFQEEGVVDVATMSQKLGIINTGLRSLAAILLKFRISKAAQVSNWAKSELSQSQVTYAATDAWVSRELFVKLRSLGVPYETNVVQ